MPPDTILPTRQGQFGVLRDPGLVWRVGYRPDPVDLDTAAVRHHGRFNGRWDDPHGRYRTLYAGQSLLSCLLEVLAGFRPDLLLAAELDQVDEDPVDAVTHPTQPAGQLPRSWLEPRVAGSSPSPAPTAPSPPPTPSPSCGPCSSAAPCGTASPTSTPPRYA